MIMDSVPWNSMELLSKIPFEQEEHCCTGEEILILKEFCGSEKKLKKQQELLLSMEKKGFLVDSFLENQEGELIGYDKDHIPFTLQHWHEGKECDTKSEEDIKKVSAPLPGYMEKCIFRRWKITWKNLWKRSRFVIIRKSEKLESSSAKEGQ